MSVGPMHASQWARIVLDELELDLSSRARHVCEALAHIADQDGATWPSVERLMHRMDRSRRYVEQGRAELVRIGLLKPDGPNRGGRRKSDGKGITARYRLALPAAEVIQNPAPNDVVDDVDAVQNPARKDSQPRTVVRTKSHTSPTVVTTTDAVPRAAPPPWIEEGMSYGAWIRRERAAGRVAKHNPVRPQ